MIGGIGKGAIFIGLSFENLDRMKQGRPMQFDGERYGLPAGTTVFIFADETEEKMLQQLLAAGLVEEDQVADALEAARMKLT